MEIIRNLERINAYHNYQLTESEVDALLEAAKRLREVEKCQNLSGNITDISK